MPDVHKAFLGTKHGIGIPDKLVFHHARRALFQPESDSVCNGIISTDLYPLTTGVCHSMDTT